MKTAVIFHGHMRTYEQTFYSQLENLLCPFHPDIFIHTWSEVEARTKSWHGAHMKVKPLDNVHLNRILEYYSPIDILVEDQPRVDDNKTTPNNAISYDGQKFMLLSLQRANALKKKNEKKRGFKYDIVVKMRPDIMMKTIFVPPQKMKDGCVGIASNQKIRACDIINFSTSKTMDKIANVVNSFDEFYVDNVINGKSVHSGYVDYMSAQGLELQFIDYMYGKNWEIIRGK